MVVFWSQLPGKLRASRILGVLPETYMRTGCTPSVYMNFDVEQAAGWWEFLLRRPDIDRLGAARGQLWTRPGKGSRSSSQFFPANHLRPRNRPKNRSIDLENRPAKRLQFRIAKADRASTLASGPRGKPAVVDGIVGDTPSGETVGTTPATSFEPPCEASSPDRKTGWSGWR